MDGVNDFQDNNNYKPRIIIILNRLVIGGPSADTISLAFYLQKKFEILILFGEKESDEIQADFLLKKYPNLQLKKIKYLRRSINPLVDVAAFFSILNIFYSFKPTIVHTHGSKSGFLGRFAAWLSSVPVIIHTFHGHLFHAYFHESISKIILFSEKLLAKITTSIITLSEQQQFDLIYKYKIADKNKIILIPLGVDESLLQENSSLHRNNFREKYGLQKNDIAIGIIGRIVPIKNHKLFIKIAEELLSKGIGNIFFFIVGDGNGKVELQNYLLSKHLSYAEGLNSTNSKFIFTSWIENVATVYHGLDILLLTSLNEGTPLSIIESQICGKPVVATNVGGVKDTFIPNKSGFLIDGFESAKYIEALMLLINNEELRKEMSNHAVEFSLLNYKKENEVIATTKLYQYHISNQPI